MAQPQTMDELIGSLTAQARTSGPKVIGTLATRDILDLPTVQRDIARRGLLAHMAAVEGIDQLAPGTTVTINAQTDQYYREADKDGIFSGLAAHIVTVAVRTR